MRRKVPPALTHLRALFSRAAVVAAEAAAAAAAAEAAVVPHPAALPAVVHLHSNSSGLCKKGRQIFCCPFFCSIALIRRKQI